MSILSDLLRDVAALFFPPRCPCAASARAGRTHGVHAVPHDGAPDGVWLEADNPCWRVPDMLPVERASGFLYTFTEAGGGS